MTAQVATHNLGSFTRYEIAADTEAEIREEIDRIKANYHPLGYGTHFSEPQLEATGRWISRGSRADSCD